MYVIMLLLGVNIYSPAGFVNVSSGIGTDLSLISYILLPVRTLNVVLSPPITILSLVAEVLNHFSTFHIVLGDAFIKPYSH